MELDRPEEAIDVGRERWAIRPDEPDVALSVAGQFALAAARFRPGESPALSILRPGRLQYAVEALHSLRHALRIVARGGKT